MHLSARKEGKRILRTLDRIEKWRVEVAEQKAELADCANSTRVATLTRMIAAREKKVLESFLALNLAPEKEKKKAASARAVLKSR